MFEIEKTFTFEAGHTLTHHDGKCQHPHGHSYTVILRLQKKELHTQGSRKNMVMDFYDIKMAMQPLLNEYLDHKWLNDTLGTDSPTAEFIAKWIFEKVKPKVQELVAVSVFETATSKATYVSD